MKNKIINLVFFIITGAILIACSHENPLDKNALSLSGKFLYQSCRYAEKQLRGNDFHGGYDYGRCVEGDLAYSTQYCQSLYMYMIEFAKKQNGLYKNITTQDLLDANTYFQVKGYYDNQTFIGEKI